MKLFALIIYFYIGLVKLERHLELVEIVWRHGHRTPDNGIESDPLNCKSSWHPPTGELTKQGMIQQYMLGQLLAERYMNRLQLLSPNDAYYHIYVHSSNFNRTIVSALSNMAGFFANSTSMLPTLAEWPSRWTPIPVHTIKLLDDINMWCVAPCPLAEKHVDEGALQPRFHKLQQENEQFYKELANYTGMDVVNMKNVWKIWDALDLIRNGSAMDWRPEEHPMPNWATPEVMERIKYLQEASTALLFRTEQQKRLRGGMLLGEIVKRMRQKQAVLSQHSPRSLVWIKDLKYFVYSGHDLNLLVLLQIFGYFNNTERAVLPTFASCLAFELWRVDDGSYEIEVVYREGPNSTVFRSLMVPGCPNTTAGCPLDQFEKYYSRYFVSDWKKECNSAVRLRFTVLSITLAVLFRNAVQY